MNISKALDRMYLLVYLFLILLLKTQCFLWENQKPKLSPPNRGWWIF